MSLLKRARARSVSIHRYRAAILATLFLQPTLAFSQETASLRAASLFLQGKGHLNNQRFEQAIEAFEKAAEIDPSSKKYVRAAANAKEEAVDTLLKRLLATPDAPIAARCDFLIRVRPWQSQEPQIANVGREVEEELRSKVVAIRLKAATGDEAAAQVLLAEVLRCSPLEPGIASVAQMLKLREDVRSVRSLLAQGQVEQAFRAAKGLKAAFPESYSVEEVESEAALRWEANILSTLSTPDESSDLRRLESQIFEVGKAIEECPGCKRIPVAENELLSKYRGQLNSYADLYRSPIPDMASGWAACRVYDRGLQVIGQARAALLDNLCISPIPSIQLRTSLQVTSSGCVESALVREAVGEVLPPGSTVTALRADRNSELTGNADLAVVVKLQDCQGPTLREERTEKVSSSYIAGSQQIANPSYANLQTQLSAMELDVIRAETNAAQNPNNLVAGLVPIALRIKRDNLRSELRSTPPFLERPIEQPYVFERFDIVATMSLSGVVEVTDPVLDLVLSRQPFRTRVLRLSSGMRGVAEQDSRRYRNIEPSVPSDDQLQRELMGSLRAELKAKLSLALARWPLERTRKALTEGSLPRSAGYLLSVRALSVLLPDEMRQGVDRELKDALPTSVAEVQSTFEKVDSLIPVVIEGSPIAEREGGARAPALPIDELRKAVVTLRSGDKAGSGFVVSGSGHILTNAHVVGLSTTVEVRTYSGDRFLGKVVQRSEVTDVALVKTDPPGTPWLSLGTAADVQLAQEILVIGAPEGLEGTVTKGIVSAIRVLDEVRMIQLDAAINPGSSGGPLLDLSGRVIGIVTWKMRGGEALGFAIAIDDALRVLPGLQREPQPKSPTPHR